MGFVMGFHHWASKLAILSCHTLNQILFPVTSVHQLRHCLLWSHRANLNLFQQVIIKYLNSFSASLVFSMVSPFRSVNSFKDLVWGYFWNPFLPMWASMGRRLPAVRRYRDSILGQYILNIFVWTWECVHLTSTVHSVPSLSPLGWGTGTPLLLQRKAWCKTMLSNVVLKSYSL